VLFAFYLAGLILVFFESFISKEEPSEAFHFTPWDLLPAAFIAAWIYSALVGFLSNNPPQLIFRNFFGYLVYSVYFVFISIRITKKEVLRSLATTALFANILTFWAILPAIRSMSLAIGTRILFSPIQLFSFLPIVPGIHLLVKQIKQNKSSKDLLLALTLLSFVIISFFTAIVLSHSKGFHLAFAISLCLLFSYELKKWSLLFLMGYALFVLTHFFPGHGLDFAYKILVGVLDPNDTANYERYRQASFFLDDITVLGRGLGSALSNFYVRDEVYHYAYELSPLNIVHKMGLVSILVFASYAITFDRILRNLLGRVEMLTSLTALSCMAFLFLGIGNPSLFSPESAILHCIALLLLRKSETV